LITPKYGEYVYQEYIDGIDESRPSFIIESTRGSCSLVLKKKPDIPEFCSWLRANYNEVDNSSPLVDLYTSEPIVLWEKRG